MEVIYYIIAIVSAFVGLVTYINKGKSDIAKNKSDIANNSGDIKYIRELIKENEEKNELAHKNIGEDIVDTKLNIVKMEGSIENIDNKIDLVLNYLQKDKES